LGRGLSVSKLKIPRLKDVSIHLKITEELNQKIEDLAEAQECSRQTLITAILVEYLEE
jgi:hypothetical protein